MSENKNEVVAKIIQAQIGTADQADFIQAHMEEYFSRWPSYKDKFTSLEWYHIFLDFLDKALSPTPIPDTRGGMRWVKASERLPEAGKRVISRRPEPLGKSGFAYSEMETDGTDVYKGMNYCRIESESYDEWISGLEWLDESPQPAAAHVGEDEFLKYLDKEIDYNDYMAPLHPARPNIFEARAYQLKEAKGKYLFYRPQPKDPASHVPPSTIKYPEPIQKRLDDSNRRRAALMESEGWGPPDYESGLQMMFILMGGWPAWEKLNPAAPSLQEGEKALPVKELPDMYEAKGAIEHLDRENDRLRNELSTLRTQLSEASEDRDFWMCKFNQQEDQIISLAERLNKAEALNNQNQQGK